MRETSSLYKTLFADDNHSTESVLVIGDYDMNEDTIPDGDKFTDSEIFSMNTHYALFDGETPAVGNTVAGELNAVILMGSKTLPRMAKLVPWIRLTGIVEGEATASEWLKKGEFFVDTREITSDDDGLDVLTIHAYDAMLKAQEDYPSDNHVYPAVDTYIVSKIASTMEVAVDERTWEIVTGNYQYGLPVGYSMQEVLSSIAVPYAGNWVVTEDGLLRLVSFAEIPKETNFLTDNVGFAIIFGTEDGSPIEPGSENNVRILV